METWFLILYFLLLAVFIALFVYILIRIQSSPTEVVIVGPQGPKGEHGEMGFPGLRGPQGYQQVGPQGAAGLGGVSITETILFYFAPNDNATFALTPDSKTFLTTKQQFGSIVSYTCQNLTCFISTPGVNFFRMRMNVTEPIVGNNSLGCVGYAQTQSGITTSFPIFLSNVDSDGAGTFILRFKVNNGAIWSTTGAFPNCNCYFVLYYLTN